MPRPATTSPSPLRAELGPRLRELVEASGVPIREVARRADLDHANVLRTLSGVYSNPRVRTVAAILGAVGATWADLDGPAAGA
jgi:transcriptional regulator with XRE-family HTH domain